MPHNGVAIKPAFYTLMLSIAMVYQISRESVFRKLDANSAAHSAWIGLNYCAIEAELVQTNGEHHIMQYSCALQTLGNS